MRRAARPAGTPIGRALDVPDGIAYDDLREVIAAIDRVHGDGDLPRKPVRHVRGATDFGRFRFDVETGAPIGIGITPDQPYRQFSLLHEIGHFLDWQGFGEEKSFGSTSNLLLRSWTRAVVASGAFRTLDEMDRRGAAIVEGGDASQLVSLSADQRVALSRFLSPEEYWARSYAQYMTQMMRLPGPFQSLTTLRIRRLDRVYYPIQWDDDDFGPIAEAIDAVMKDFGWRA